MADVLIQQWGEPLELFPYLMVLLIFMLALENLLSNKFTAANPRPFHEYRTDLATGRSVDEIRLADPGRLRGLLTLLTQWTYWGVAASALAN